MPNRLRDDPKEEKKHNLVLGLNFVLVHGYFFKGTLNETYILVFIHIQLYRIFVSCFIIIIN